MIVGGNLGSHLYGWDPDDTAGQRYVEGVDYRTWTTTHDTASIRGPKPPAPDEPNPDTKLSRVLAWIRQNPGRGAVEICDGSRGSLTRLHQRRLVVREKVDGRYRYTAADQVQP